jgi:hypothetical protein
VPSPQCEMRLGGGSLPAVTHSSSATSSAHNAGFATRGLRVCSHIPGPCGRMPSPCGALASS